MNNNPLSLFPTAYIFIMKVHCDVVKMTEDEVKPRKERDPIMMVCFVVFLLASVSAIGATVYNNYISADDTVAISGDSVTVNYIGTYYDFYQDTNFVVFDTNIWSVTNNDGVPKSNGFVAREESGHIPLSFTVGGSQVLKMFGDAVIGHKVGDKITVKIPAGEGYNSADTTTRVNAASSVTIPATEMMTLAQFQDVYGHALSGVEEIKSVYGWPAIATYNMSTTMVMISHLPVANQTYVMQDDDFGKVSVKVSAANSSSVIYTYEITDFTVVSQNGNDKEIQMILLNFGSEKRYITTVTDTNNDGVADFFVYKTDGERYNQDLYFQIEIVSIN